MAEQSDRGRPKMRRYAYLMSISSSLLCFVIGGSIGEVFIAGGVGYSLWYLMMIYEGLK